MDYDESPPFPASQYRRMQLSIPGVDGFYRLVAAVLSSETPSDAHVLIVGAGGGREIETIGAMPGSRTCVAVDPSVAMMASARDVAAGCGMTDRTIFLTGTIDDVSLQPLFDAATSLLVMHFLDDDGAKAAYLQAIRRRLKNGALLLHADVCASSGDLPCLGRWFAAHADMVGLTAEEAAAGPRIIADLPIVDEARTSKLFALSGFADPLRLFQGLWYTLWACRAV